MAVYDYEINRLGKEESWWMFRIIGEFVEGFDTLAGIEPAVSFYGSARTKEDDPLWAHTAEIAYRLGVMGYSIVTGGGPGVMAAANSGAKRAGAQSIGLNIELPMEQSVNPYVTKTITFHHFFVRKVMLVKYATVFIIMPGGLGTLDELSEVLTLIQTKKIKPFPVILYDSKYWEGFLNWMRDSVLARGNISPEDMNLVRVLDTPEDVVETVQMWHKKHTISGKGVLNGRGT